MNAESLPDADAPRRILVWDLPVRVFHWLMVICFVGAYITAEGERWRQVHLTLGYTMAGLVAFRIVWGFVGTRHARFASFVRGPAAVARYLRGMLGRGHEDHVGHNPVGALAIVALIAMTVLVALTGWATDQRIGGEAFEEAHEVLANVMLGIVVVHVVGVLIGSWLQRENLIGAMFTGRLRGAPADGIRRPWSGVALVLLAAVLGFWWLQSGDAPLAGGSHAAARPDDD